MTTQLFVTGGRPRKHRRVSDDGTEVASMEMRDLVETVVVTDARFAAPWITRLPRALQSCCCRYLDLEALVELHTTQRDVRRAVTDYFETAETIRVTTRERLVDGLSLLRRHAKALCELIVAKDIVLTFDARLVARQMCIDISEINGATLRHLVFGPLLSTDVWEAIVAHCSKLQVLHSTDDSTHSNDILCDIHTRIVY